MGILNHLTCLLRNLNAGQETTVRTGHGTDWLQIGKIIRQGCILSPCLLVLYTQYIRRNAGLDEAWAGIKITRRYINNLRYADDTTLMADIEEELKSFLMRAKEEREKAGLKLNILAPQSRHTVHLRWYSQGALRKQRNGAYSPTQTHSPPETVCSPSTRSPELLRHGEDTKCTAHLGLCPCGVPENLSHLNWKVHETQGPIGTVPSKSTMEPEQYTSRKHRLPWVMANPVWSIHFKHSPDMPVVFVCSVPHPPQHKWTSEPKWVATFIPCVSAEMRHWRDLQTEEAKIKKREPLWKWQVQQIKTL